MLDEDQPHTQQRLRLFSQFSRPAETSGRRRSRPVSQGDSLYSNVLPPRPPASVGGEFEYSERRRSRHVGESYDNTPPPRPPASVDGEIEYSERVVRFLQQSDIFDQLRERSGEAIESSLRYMKVGMSRDK